MVLIVSSPSPSNDSPSPRGPKNLVVLVCHFTSPNNTAKNSVVVINYNDRTTNRSKCVRGANLSPEGDRDVLNKKKKLSYMAKLISMMPKIVAPI